MTRYYYDESAPWGSLGRLTSIERENDASSAGLMQYEYDFEGRTTNMRTPSGVYQYSYVTRVCYPAAR